MTEIISARFKSGGKAYYFDPAGIALRPGDAVIVETSKGLEYGECVQGNTMVEDDRIVQPLRPVIRPATEEDKNTVEQNREKEKKAFAICQEKIAEHELDMKLVEVEYSFDGSKILFFFTSENRVDFRALVRDLAAQFHSRIELRQIGVRDESKMLGGLGICGRPFCCSQFLEEFQPVSIKMAKTQNLSLNPTKISGTCGRLMCCLKYEQDAYEDAVKRCPKQESFVETPEGIGNVTGVNLLRETVTVRLDEEPENAKVFHTSEINVVRNGKGKRPDDYVAPSREELAKLRKVTPKEEPDSLSRRLDFLLQEKKMDVPEEKPAAPEKRERRSQPKVEKQPAEPVKKEEAAAPKEQQGKKNHRSRNRNKGQNQGGEAKQQAVKPAEKPQAKSQPAPKAEGNAPAAEGGEKKPQRRHRHRHHRGGKGKGGNAAPKSE